MNPFNLDNASHRSRRIWIVAAWMLAVISTAAAELQTFKGTLANTTHDISAAVGIELTIKENGDVSGWIEVAEPLLPGRWPLTGVRKGAWLELTCSQVAGATTRLRGIVDPKTFRGTFVFEGDAVLTQYGRFQLTTTED